MGQLLLEWIIINVLTLALFVMIYIPIRSILRGRNPQRFCRHEYRHSRFMDFHTGADGEIYCRCFVICRHCGKEVCHAVALPRTVNEMVWELPNEQRNVLWHAGNRR